MSHLELFVLVHAKDAQEATHAASCELENYVGERGDFDFGDVLDKEAATRYLGVDVSTPAVEVDSAVGKLLVEEQMKSQEATLLWHLKRVRAYLEKFTDEQLVAQEEEDAVDGLGARIGVGLRHHAYCFGEYSGSNTFIIGAEWGGIRSRKELKKYLSWIPAEGEKVFLVIADVHH